MQTLRNIAYLTARETIELRTGTLPQAGKGEVVVRMKAVGVCGSDVSYFKNGRTGVGEISFPHILGHECAGVVAQVGPGVSALRAGDRVATEPGYFCGHCEQCVTGRYNLCRSMSFMGSAVAAEYGEGALVEYSVRPAHLVCKLPDNVDFDEGALIEPLSVGLHAIRRAGLCAGARAAILGCGPIAASTLLVLQALGASSVSMTDIIPTRLARMKALGAARVINVDGLPFEETTALFPEGSLDAVFDTTCNEQAINASMRWVKKGGSIVQIGVPGGKIQLDAQTLFNRGLSFLPSFRYKNTYPTLLSLVSAGKIAPKALISHRFPFSETQKAFDLAASRAAGVMKIIIDFP